MEDYELTINAVECYKDKACKIANYNCNRCEGLHECNDRHWCAFDTVIRFIKYDNGYYNKEV